MKYTIARQFSIKKEKFEIINDSKTVCKVAASLSKEHKGQYNVKMTNSPTKFVGDDSCIIEPHFNNKQNYLIYLKNSHTHEKILFGQLSYEFCSYNNYLYEIIIGRKLYKVRSCDLKNRRLAIVDTVQPDPSKSQEHPALQCPETLFQVIDSFSKSNKSYHVTINDKEKQLGYLAIVVLLDLHECERA